MRRKLLDYIKIFLCAILIGCVGLLAAYALPMSNINEHIQESMSVFKSEGDYPKEVPKQRETQRDNFTDALMLNIAGYNSDKGLLEKAFGNYYTMNEETAASKWLRDRNEDGQTEISYARYWHGYVTILKALLVFFNYQEIRQGIYFIEFLLIVYIALLLQKKQKGKYIAPFLIALMYFPLTVVSKSLQYSTVFIPTLVGIAVALQWEKKWRGHYEKLFFTMGIVIAYFDLLTYPLVNAGFLLCFVLIMDEEYRTIDKLKKSIGYLIAWFVGYAGMWGSKWLVSSVILRRNVLTDAMDAAAFRVSNGNGDEKWNYLDVVKRNIENSPKFILLAGIIIVIILMVVCMKEKINKEKMRSNSVFLLAAILPFVWYRILENHSYIHSFFTHRELAITCMAVLFYLASIFEARKAVQK